MGDCSRYQGSGCILVEDAKVMARGKKHFPVIDLTSISPKSSDGKCNFCFHLIFKPCLLCAAYLFLRKLYTLFIV